MQEKLAEEAKGREENRDLMQEQLQNVQGEISNIQGRLIQTHEDKKEAIQAANATITVENLPDHADEQLIRNLFDRFPGITKIFINEATHVAVIDYETNLQAKNARDGKL